eukprot:m.86621 g.86621  ORF g.86621 m.86621 type:complete len:73 (+) comp14475_c1_seq1:241-459(+)
MLVQQPLVTFSFERFVAHAQLCQRSNTYNMHSQLLFVFGAGEKYSKAATKEREKKSREDVHATKIKDAMHQG